MALLPLIDGDILVYRIGFSAETTIYVHKATSDVYPTRKNYRDEGIDDSEVNVVVMHEDDSVAIGRMRRQLQSIVNTLDADECRVYLSGVGNFREDITATYKANRKDSTRPHHYYTLRQYLVEHWDAQVVDNMEADDALGIAQATAFEAQGKKCSTCIVTIDKDLDMIPGLHYNWTKKKTDDRLYWIDPFLALYNFYTQLLVGDPVDNIKGVPKIGPKKAEKLLKGCTTEYEMFVECARAYERHWGAAWTHHLNENASLLWILRAPGGYWRPPTHV